MASKVTLLLLMLLKIMDTVTTGKYVFVQHSLNWLQAQKHCRTHYTDLASINSEYDTSLIRQMNPIFENYGWIGLINTTNSSTGWMWSGGGEVSTFFWREGEPNNYRNHEDNGGISAHRNHSWFDINGDKVFSFFCYKVHAVRKRMTWDDALQYCRKNHHDLASVASETEMMQIEKELGKELSSENVWIGLQFMDSSWQWMDGQPFTFESWGPLVKPVCPDITFACGALKAKGQFQKVEEDYLGNVRKVLGWNARDCNRKLHFLCY